MNNIVRRKKYTVAHVENFAWEPLTPIVLSVDDYSKMVEMTLDEAVMISDALLAAVREYRRK